MVRLGVNKHGAAIAVVNRSEIVNGAERADCPQVQHAVLLLTSLPLRVRLFQRNNRTLGGELRYFRAVDGLDREAALQSWRALGVRFLHNHPSTRRSFGQFACTLSKCAPAFPP